MARPKIALIGAGQIAVFTSREFRRHPDCQVVAVADPSGERAAELAGALGFVALTRRDRVELHLPGAAPARFSGRNGVAELFARLETLEADGAGSLSRTATEVLGRHRGPGMTVLCSDLLEPDWNTALQRLPARGSELVVMHVLGEGELDPPELGDVDLVDVETGERVAMTLTPGNIRDYQSRLAAWLETVRRASSAVGQEEGFERALEAFRQRFRRRTALLRLLDERGLA